MLTNVMGRILPVEDEKSGFKAVTILSEAFPHQYESDGLNGIHCVNVKVNFGDVQFRLL